MCKLICDGELYLNEDGDLVEISYDCDAGSPREWDNLGHFLTWTSSYNSPDENPYDYPEELAGDLGIYDEYGDNGDLFDLIKGMNEMGWVALPVSMVDHSGVAYRVGNPSQFIGAYPWDAGYVGIIYATANELCEWFCVSEVTDDIRQRAISCLTGDVEVYSGWANGTCYGFRTYDIDGNESDSCWGFIGDDAETNGIEDYCGNLNECDFDSVEEYVEAHAYDVTIDRAMAA